ncbi:hypothetical protein [uncultured Paludibaculum sp.]|uniref:hypothetical protein n=1 Tax=uncultured Paludibaculum sp. TaxID=1765020 RepID=UPI002AABCB06|nr:hypothetical protein [uncultured Paludibaculum sp.]
MVHYTDEQYADHAPAIAAEQDGLATAKSKLEELVAIGLEAARVSERAHEAYEAEQEGIASLEEQGKAEAEALRAKQIEAFTEAPQNIVFDHDAAIDAIERHQRRASYFKHAVDFARSYGSLVRLLGKLEADAELAAAHCSVVSQRAMISAVERFIAAQSLLHTETVVHFPSGPNSKTGALIEDARDAFRTAYQAMEAVTNERSRQVSLGIGIALGGAK